MNPALLETAIPLDNADVTLVDSFLSHTEADTLFHSLMQQVEWHQPELQMFGRKVLSPRLAAWYGDANAVYQYSGLVNKPLPWFSELTDIKDSVEKHSGTRFNSVLINLYRDGNDAMGWHADDEPELGMQPCIASLSLGAARTFLMRKKKRVCGEPSRKIVLDDGSLLIMKGDTQGYWQHSVSRTKVDVLSRVNLTFRFIVR